jgi:hypothetical protein
MIFKPGANMKKYIFLLFLMQLFVNKIFAYSYKREYFQIINCSNRNIEVMAEFWERESNNVWEWDQNIGGDININVRTAFGSGTNTHILYPEETFGIVSYSPNYSSFEFGEYYYKLQNLSILEKLNAIFKSLAIYNENGEILLLLEDFNEIIIKKSTSIYNVNYYYVEIYEPEEQGL